MPCAKEEGQTVGQATLDSLIHAAVVEVVAKQYDAGLDVINDDELGKVTDSVYVKDRLNGCQYKHLPRPFIVEDDFPGYAERMGTCKPRTCFARPDKALRPQLPRRKRTPPATGTVPEEGDSTSLKERAQTYQRAMVESDH